MTGYQALVTGAFGGSYALGATAVKAVPLLLVGVGICIAFRANVFNIGGEGQIAMGGLAGTATALALPESPEPGARSRSFCSRVRSAAGAGARSPGPSRRTST